MGSCEQILGRGCPDFALGAAGFCPFLQTAENDSKFIFVLQKHDPLKIFYLQYFPCMNSQIHPTLQFLR